MIFYRRNIDNNLLALRFTSIVLGLFCYFAFSANRVNLGYSLLILLILQSLIIVKDFIVLPDSFKVKKYYFFGFIPLTWIFIKKEIPILRSYGSDFEMEVDPFESIDAESTVGCLFFFYSFFGKRNSITHKKFTIRKNIQSNFNNRVDIMLTNEEYQLIREMVQS